MCLLLDRQGSLLRLYLNSLIGGGDGFSGLGWLQKGICSHVIGEMNRHVSTRVREHLSTGKNSYIFKHWLVPSFASILFN